MTFHKNNNGVSHYNEHSPYFANFYQLLSNLVSVNQGLTPKVIMFTSAKEREGKTTIATYSSITAAISSPDYDFYLMIDGDLRNPGLHKRFGFPLNSGLTDILMNKKRAMDVIRKTPFEALHFISAGKRVSNPFQLLSLEKTKQLFKRLSSYYKMVIIDGPPIIPVSDTLRLAQIVDGVILTVQAGKTPRVVVKRALELLQEARCRVLGTVLNDVNEILPYYYQNNFYSYKQKKQFSNAS